MIEYLTTEGICNLEFTYLKHSTPKSSVYKASSLLEMLRFQY